MNFLSSQVEFFNGLKNKWQIEKQNQFFNGHLFLLFDFSSNI